MKQIINKALIAESDRRFHRKHRLEACGILRGIEAAKGKTSPTILKLADEYARDVFGSKKYAPWLYVYSAVGNKFKEGWIPDNYYGRVVVPIINRPHGSISGLKTVSKMLFNDDSFPDLAFYVNGFFFSKEYDILSEADLKEVLFKNSEKVVFKLDDSAQGFGIYFFNRSSIDLRQIRSLGSGVFQEYIHQHPFFDEIMPSSVATLRITTLLNDSGVFSVRACYLRVGRGGDSHVKHHTQVQAPIDIISEKLGPKGYLNTWVDTETHPDTKFVFADKKIPELENCLKTVLELHRMFPFARCIGWDVVVDKDSKVKVMEWNAGHNGIKFAEATQGPCFKDLGWERIRSYKNV